MKVSGPADAVIKIVEEALRQGCSARFTVEKGTGE